MILVEHLRSQAYGPSYWELWPHDLPRNPSLLVALLTQQELEYTLGVASRLRRVCTKQQGSNNMDMRSKIDTLRQDGVRQAVVQFLGQHFTREQLASAMAILVGQGGLKVSLAYKLLNDAELGDFEGDTLD